MPRSSCRVSGSQPLDFEDTCASVFRLSEPPVEPEAAAPLTTAADVRAGTVVRPRTIMTRTHAWAVRLCRLAHAAWPVRGSGTAGSDVNRP